MAWNGEYSGRLTVGHPNIGFGSSADLDRSFESKKAEFDKMYHDGLIDQEDYTTIIKQLEEEHRKTMTSAKKAEAGEMSPTEITNFVGKITASLGKSVADMYLGFLQYKMQLRALRGGVAAGSGLPMGTGPGYITTGGPSAGISKKTMLLGALGIGAFVIAIVALRK